MYKFAGDDRSGSRTGPEVMTGETTKLASSVRPDFGCVCHDEGRMHECRKAMNMPQKVRTSPSALVSEVKRSPDRQEFVVERMLPGDVQVSETCFTASLGTGLYPISPLVRTVGEPYRGKPDVRFDEGDLRTSARQG